MKKILLTGGAGYIGSKISYDLTDEGYKIIVADNLCTGFKKLINKKAIFYEIDIGNQQDLEKIFKKHKIETVIHLAASLSVEESMKNPVKYYLNNVVNTKNLLNVCGKFRIKKFIFSSTCAIYGETIKTVRPNDIPNPTSHYGITKLLCENLIKDYSKLYGFDFFILRYFNVAGADHRLRVGPINQSGQLFKNLATNIRKKKYEINIFGKNYKTRDGTCIRDYIDLNDLSKIHINCIKKTSNKKSMFINCGYGKGYSVLEIIRSFERVIGRNISKIYKKPRKGDVSEIICIPSKSKMFKKLYSHKFSLENSVKSALKWEFKN